MNDETQKSADHQELQDIEAPELSQSAHESPTGEADAAADIATASGSESVESAAPEAEAQTQAPEPQQSPQIDYTGVLAELTQTIDTLKSQLEDRNNQYVRIAADFENFRRRTQKEKEDLESQVKCSTINKLLPVVDNFERARLQIKPKTDEGMNVHKSYQGVYKELVDCLKQIGVAPMRSEGQEFDPNLHEAVMRESTDQHAEGTVLEELRRGYLLGDRVLRHALVKVATAPEPASDGSTSEA
jgi:molecular chaperone GrpE